MKNQNQSRTAFAGQALFLMGPTAVGKTDFSLYLAEKLSAGILNCDSMQIYKGLNIGSAKPPLHPSGRYILSKNKKKIPAYLFNEWHPSFICTAGVFRKKALCVLKKEIPRRLMVAVGGSGFYIQALQKGMYPVKAVSAEIKKQVEDIQRKKGAEHLYKLLEFLDPKYARQISPQDRYRVFRGVCLILSEERPLSVIRADFKEKPPPWPFLKAGLYLPRERLLQKVRDRTGKMIKEGLLEETQSLLDKGLEGQSILKSPGYKEAVLRLQGKISEEELKTQIIYRTMRLAKRQMTWFRRDKSIKWYLCEDQNRIYSSLRKRLNIYSGKRERREQ